MSPSNHSKFTETGGRRADRRRYEGQVQFRKGTKRAMVQVHDISRYGARINGVYLVREDDRLFLTLPGMASIEARVAWVTQFEFGCEFLQPLSDVILDFLIKGR